LLLLPLWLVRVLHGHPVLQRMRVVVRVVVEGGHKSIGLLLLVGILHLLLLLLLGELGLLVRLVLLRVLWGHLCISSGRMLSRVGSCRGGTGGETPCSSSSCGCGGSIGWVEGGTWELLLLL